MFTLRLFRLKRSNSTVLQHLQQDVWIWFSPLFCLFFFTIEKLCISEQNYLYQHLIEQQNSRGPEGMLRKDLLVAVYKQKHSEVKDT